MTAIFMDQTFRFWLSLALVIIILGILFRFRAKKNPKKDSLELLKERFERGEISKEVYDRARKQRGK
ncbi:hypothetical protein GCM10007111_31480 [Virgibacillus kapii]|nr:SHOCT domain-containing protein [Virgibacillus massiliensis]EQB38933.1 hypothetical protein M948_00890 [Virgibacillus sp. CM-4]GGJ67272.1 hypothetical protein GCM10007111_31480 [Virgibacillus kapii]